jgi:hypothetical protein
VNILADEVAPRAQKREDAQMSVKRVHEAAGGSHSGSRVAVRIAEKSTLREELSDG